MVVVVVVDVAVEVVVASAVVAGASVVVVVAGCVVVVVVAGSVVVVVGGSVVVVVVAAVLGRTLLSGERIPLLMETFRSDNKKLFQLALGTVREFPGSVVDKALAAEMQKASPDRAALIVQAMADRYMYLPMNTKEFHQIRDTHTKIRSKCQQCTFCET